MSGTPRRGRSPFFAVVMTLVALGLLGLSVPNIAPVLRAARADGVTGTFTARTLQCLQHPGHESCTWFGEFRSDDGLIHHGRIAMYGSDRDALRAGTPTRAVDVGRPRQVYGPGGSREWIFTSLLTAAGAGILIFLYGGAALSALRTRRTSTA